MFKSLYTLIAAQRYPTAEAAKERVVKAYPKYLSEQQFNTLLSLIAEVYGGEAVTV